MPARDLPQFTPAQVLDAARRAESEGRTDFAIQFYQHLSTNFPGTSEAAAADLGLAQLVPSPQTNSAGFGDPYALSDPHQQNGYALNNPFQSAPGHDHFNAPHASYAPAPQQQYPAQPSAGPSDGLPAIDLPHQPSDYRTARILARLVTWIGGLMIPAGVLLAALAIASPKSLGAMPLIGAIVTGPVSGGLVALCGFFQIFFGQSVRALLDQANATRDLAALTRARLEGRPPQHRRRSRH